MQILDQYDNQIIIKRKAIRDIRVEPYEDGKYAMQVTNTKNKSYAIRIFAEKEDAVKETNEFIKAVLRREKTWFIPDETIPPKPVAVLLDDGLSPIDVLENYSIHYQPGTKTREAFEEAIQALEEYSKKKLRDKKRLEDIKASLNPVRTEPSDENERDFTVWTNEDAGDDMDMLSFIEEYPDDCLGLSKEEIYERCLEDNESLMDDEIANLKCYYGEIYGTDRLDILTIVDAGLWDGRRLGCKADLDKDISQIFRIGEGDIVCIYGDRGNLRIRSEHHDGTNYYTIRRILPEHVEGIYDVMSAVNDKKLFWELVDKYTESLWPLLEECYGWNITAEREGKKHDKK